MKPDGFCTHASSCRTPLTNAFLMYISFISHLYVITKVKITRIVVGLTTIEKVSWKSKPCCWWNHLAINLALYFLILPLGFSLTLKTNLQFILERELIFIGDNIFRDKHYASILMHLWLFFCRGNLQVYIFDAPKL